MNGEAGREAIFIALVYMAIAAVWIAASDALVAMLTDDPTALSRLQTLKGWLFVALTGVLLYGLVRRSIVLCLGERADRLVSERRYRTLLETLPHGVAEVNAECAITYANPALNRMLGYAGDELDGRSLPSLLADAAEQAELAEHCRRLLHGGQPPPLFRARGCRKDAREVRLEMAWVLRREEAGPPPGMTLMVTDVSDRHAAEVLALGQRHEREAALAQLETLYATAPVGLCFVDRELRFVRINERLASINGVSVADHIGRTIESIMPKMAPKLMPLYQRVLTSGTPILDQEMKGEMPGVEGERYWLMSYFPVAQDGGVVIGVSAVVLDITERKLYERRLRDAAAELARKSAHLERVNSELEQFSYVVAHDLKAPLRAVANLSEWLREDLGRGLPAKSRHYIDLLRNRVMRMDALINALLEYSRVGGMDARPEPVDLNALVQDAIAAQRLPEGFQVVADPGLPVVCTCRWHLAQVLTNLIGNAVEHHDRPQGRVAIHARRVDGRIEVAVEDDGPGIAPEFQRQVFEMFQTLAVSDDPHHVGIGLPMVRKLVEGHGGDVRLDSQPGHGTTVRFTWAEAQC